ncbi:MAG TPA: hypothetical protein VFQ35_24660, partial [Polyangiaceae bacterium]|nr:hypothetical protein [Polyangiaceae bacterium]
RGGSAAWSNRDSAERRNLAANANHLADALSRIATTSTHVQPQAARAFSGGTESRGQFRYLLSS